MRYEWMLDVLADLRGFAAANGLPKLAGTLDEAAAVAEAEISEAAARTAGRPDPAGPVWVPPLR